MVTTPRISKTYTISLPPDLAAKAEAVAREESRNMSDLFREALRSYSARRIQEAFAEATSYASARNPYGYTESDIPRLIPEVRVEQAGKMPLGGQPKPLGRRRRYQHLDLRAPVQQAEQRSSTRP